MRAAIGRSRVDTARKCRGREGRGTFIHHQPGFGGILGVTDTRCRTDKSLLRMASRVRLPHLRSSPGAPAVNTYRKAGQSKRRQKRGRGGRTHGLGFHEFLLFYPLYYLIPRPSWGWGLGSAMQEIRHCFSRFAIARLLAKKRPTQAKTRCV